MDEEELRATRMGQEEHPGSKKNGKSQGWPGGPNLLKALRFVLLLPHVAVSAHCAYILIFYIYKRLQHAGLTQRRGSEIEVSIPNA